MDLNTVVLGQVTNRSLIMMHGWGQSLNALRGLGGLLSSNFYVHLIDLPGFGNSPLPHFASTEKGAWSTLDYANVVKAYIEERNLNKPHILGHSFGGRVCLQLAANYSELIDNVILIDSAGLKPIRDLRERLRFTWIKITKNIIIFSNNILPNQIYKKLHAWFVSKYGSPDFQEAGNLKNILVKAVTEDQSQNARSIKNKVLVLWGEEDSITPLYMAHQFNKYIANSTLVSFGHKGHEPFNGLGSHLCAHYILKFLSKK